MKTREIVLGAAAFLCIGALSSAQIAPQGHAAPQPRSQQPRPDPIAGPVTTLAGCLYREDSIAGRKPNVAEKAGVIEDYILFDATPVREQNRLPDRQSLTQVSHLTRPQRGSQVAACTKSQKLRMVD